MGFTTEKICLDSFAEIPGFDGAYLISKDGVVVSVRVNGKIDKNRPTVMKQFVNNTPMWKKGKSVLKVSLQDSNKKKKNYSVMSLMVKTWYGGKPEGKIAYHKNGSPFDNSLQNIGFITRKEFASKLNKSGVRKPVAKIDSHGNVIEFYASISEAARKNFYSDSTISDRCNGKVKNPFRDTGFTFQYDY